MDFGSRNALSDRVFGARATCPNCKNQFTYRAGAELARKNGIYDNVAVCGGCGHVYTCVLIPGRLTLQNDVTERYAAVQAKAVQREENAEETEKRSGEKRGFFRRIFGK